VYRSIIANNKPSFRSFCIDCSGLPLVADASAYPVQAVGTADCYAYTTMFMGPLSYVQSAICPITSMEPHMASFVPCIFRSSPFPRHSTMVDRAFAVAGPQAWNSLSEAVCHSSSLASSNAV